MLFARSYRLCFLPVSSSHFQSNKNMVQGPQLQWPSSKWGVESSCWQDGCRQLSWSVRGCPRRLVFSSHSEIVRVHPHWCLGYILNVLNVFRMWCRYNPEMVQNVRAVIESDLSGNRFLYFQRSGTHYFKNSSPVVVKLSQLQHPC